MKKSNIYLVIAVVLLIAVVGFIVSQIMEGNKTLKKVSAEDFFSKMIDYGYGTEETTDQYTGEGVTKSYKIVEKDYKYQMSFLQTETDEAAGKIYDFRKNEYLNDKDASSKKEKSGKNYKQFEMFINGRYRCVLRVENTVLYFDAPQEDKDYIISKLKLVGYNLDK